MQVLIVDDSPVARALLRAALASLGATVLEAESCAGAKALPQSPLVCAVLDLNLDDGLGTEIAASLRAAHPELPIAFLTGSKIARELEDAAGYGPVFEKPSGLRDATMWVELQVQATRSPDAGISFLASDF
jgi:CheY-like chemotaxis protein